MASGSIDGPPAPLKETAAESARNRAGVPVAHWLKGAMAAFEERPEIL